MKNLSKTDIRRGPAPVLSSAGLLVAGAILGLSALPVRAAFTYPGCDPAAESQFRYVPVIGRKDPVTVGGPVTKPLVVDADLWEPLHLAFDLQANGKADIYFVEKTGGVKFYNATANTVTLLGKVTGISTGSEFGLTGIALDPNFKTNKYIYLYMAHASPAEFWLSRFTLVNGKLDLATEKNLLKFRRGGGNHTGGAMAFDAYGDLWMTVGKNATDYPNSYSETTENSSSEATSGNLADLRGGVIRIHPDNSAKGYSIPAGNFGAYWADHFRAKGNTTLADQYANPAKVLPELYVKGTRNAYSIAVHPTKRWLAWGEFGVNTSNTMTEEHNLVTHPAYGGYPYFAGGFGTGAGTGYYNLWSAERGAPVYNAAHPGLAQSIAGPVNNSVFNKGPKDLPPVTPALHTYMHGSGAGAVTGPIYTYDPAVKSNIKWPPHFNNSWFITDWVQGTGNNGFKGAKIFKLSESGDRVVDSVKWFQNLDWFEPISFDQGPDGAIYVIMYHGWHTADAGTHIGRLEYTGACKPDSFATALHESAHRAAQGLHASPGRVSVTETGASRLIIRDSRGREMFRADLQGPREYTLGDLVQGRPGIYVATLSSASGSARLKLINP